MILSSTNHLFRDKVLYPFLFEFVDTEQHFLHLIQGDWAGVEWGTSFLSDWALESDSMILEMKEGAYEPSARRR